MGKRFSEQERMEAVAAYVGGESLGAVATRMSASVQSVSNWVTASGMRMRSHAASHALAVERGLGRFRGRAVCEQAEALYCDGMGTTAIAKEMGVPVGFVMGVIERAGILRTRKEAAVLAADATSQRMRQYAVNEAAFDGELDIPRAWVLGVIYGNGWIDRANGVEHGVGVCGDEDVVCKVLAILGSEHPVNKKGGCFIAGIGSMRLARNIARWGVTPAKARTLVWPRSLPVELETHFLRGLFDADGWVGRDPMKPVIGIGLAAKSIIESIADRMAQIGGRRPKVQHGKARKKTHADRHTVVLYGDRAISWGRWLWSDSIESMRSNRKHGLFALLSVT